MTPATIGYSSTMSALGRSLVFGLFAVLACDTLTVDDLFDPASSELDSARSLVPSNECGAGGHTGSILPVMDVPEEGIGSTGGGAQSLPSDPSTSTSTSGSSISNSSSLGDGSGGNDGGTTCLTCDAAVEQFREGHGRWEGFCTEIDNADAWEYARVCFCDPTYGGCATDCGHYCTGDHGPVPAGSACDTCTRDHRGKCGPFLSNCDQASTNVP